MKAAPIEKIIGDKCPSSGAAYRIPLSNGIKMNSTNVAQAPSKTLDSANVAFMGAGAVIVGVVTAVGSGPGAFGAGAAGAAGAFGAGDAGAVGAGAAILTSSA